LANKIKDISEKNPEIKIKKSGMNKEYTCDNSRLMKEIKEFKFTNIEYSIKELFDWYLKNKDKIKKEDLLIF
jgi:UDP-glucose 4-epimerase